MKTVVIERNTYGLGDDAGNDHSLQQKARHNRNWADIVDGTDARHEDYVRKDRIKLCRRGRARREEINTPHIAAIVAAMTAMPPPCGVGSR